MQGQLATSPRLVAASSAEGGQAQEELLKKTQEDAIHKKISMAFQLAKKAHGEWGQKCREYNGTVSKS